MALLPDVKSGHFGNPETKVNYIHDKKCLNKLTVCYIFFVVDYSNFFILIFVILLLHGQKAEAEHNFSCSNFFLIQIMIGFT